MTVCIVHYNTPELTTATICSLWKHHRDASVIVFDNSDSRPFTTDGLNGFNGRDVKVIDNTKGQIIDFDAHLQQFPDKETGPINKSNYGSAKHALSVQWLIDTICEPFMLMDSDILICQPIDRLCRPRYAFVGKIVCNTRQRFGLEIYRAEPFLCYLNVPVLHKHGVRYYNPDYMWALSSVSPNNRYDAGAWFLKDVKSHCLPYFEIDTAPYILHFGHGSWSTRDSRDWLEDHHRLWR